MFSKFNKVGIIPTDTVYGLVCVADDKTSIDKIYKIKNRPKTKQVPVIVQNINMLKNIAEISADDEDFIKTYHNQGFSFLVKLKDSKYQHLSLNDKISVRIVSNRHIHDLFQNNNKPIVATSLNLSDEKDIFQSNKIPYDIIKEVDFCSPDDSCVKFKTFSTVIDIETKEIVRHGAGKLEQTTKKSNSTTSPTKEPATTSNTSKKVYNSKKTSEEVKDYKKTSTPKYDNHKDSNLEEKTSEKAVKKSTTKPKKATDSSAPVFTPKQEDQTKRSKPISARKLKTLTTKK
jgi:L-threonylcarbamoyladenylate synthase